MVADMPAPSPPIAQVLTERLLGAQRGFRSDVARLIEGLAGGELVIPLAKDLPEIPEGERVEVHESIEISPYLLMDPEGGAFFVVFSEAGLFTAMASENAGEEVRYCTMPALQALHMALDVLDNEDVRGLVFNPGHASELVLRRSELASLVNGTAIPLVGYVGEFLPSDEEGTIVADGAAAPPPAFEHRIQQVVQRFSSLSGYALSFCFNAERDLEPHWVLRIVLQDASADRQEISRNLFESVEGVVPAPGYFDVVFESRGPEAR